MKSCVVVVIVGLLVSAGAVFAKPPQIDGFVRLDQLRRVYKHQIDRLKSAEAFTKLPREGKMVELFKRGVNKFEGHTLDGYYLVDQILIKWTDFDTAKPTDSALRVTALLPKALRDHFSQKGASRDDRWKTGRILAQHLADQYVQVRKTANDCLKAIYGISIQYKPDASLSQLLRWRHEWRKYVDSTHRR